MFLRQVSDVINIQIFDEILQRLELIFGEVFDISQVLFHFFQDGLPLAFWKGVFGELVNGFRNLKTHGKDDMMGWISDNLVQNPPQASLQYGGYTSFLLLLSLKF